MFGFSEKTESFIVSLNDITVIKNKIIESLPNLTFVEREYLPYETFVYKYENEKIVNYDLVLFVYATDNIDKQINKAIYEIKKSCKETYYFTLQYVNESLRIFIKFNV